MHRAEHTQPISVAVYGGDLAQTRDYRDFLRAYVEGKRKESRSWSLGVWARQLGIKSPSLLVMILNGQRHPGPNLLASMVRFFDFDAEQARFFEDLVRIQKLEKSVRGRLQIMDEFRKRHPHADLHTVDHKKFAVISNWYCYAIREMINLPDFRDSAPWIAKRLGGRVAASTVRQAIHNLIDVGLVERDTRGRLRVASGAVRTADDIADEGLRRYHAQALDQAKHALEKTDVKLREISGGCFPVARKDLDQAKRLIRKFQHDLCQLCDTDKPDEVYQLEVAFFPLTKTTKKRVKVPVHQ